MLFRRLSASFALKFLKIRKGPSIDHVDTFLELSVFQLFWFPFSAFIFKTFHWQCRFKESRYISHLTNICNPSPTQRARLHLSQRCKQTNPLYFRRLFVRGCQFAPKTRHRPATDWQPPPRSIPRTYLNVVAGVWGRCPVGRG